MLNCYSALLHTISFISSPDLQFESAKAFINIASGTSDPTNALVSAGAVAGLISLSGSPHLVVAVQAVRDLGSLQVTGQSYEISSLNKALLSLRSL